MQITRDDEGWWLESLGNSRLPLLNGAQGAADLARWLLEPLRTDVPVTEKTLPVVEFPPVGPDGTHDHGIFYEIEMYRVRESLDGPESLSVEVFGMAVPAEENKGKFFFDPCISPEAPSIDRPALNTQARRLLAAAERELKGERVEG